MTSTPISPGNDTLFIGLSEASRRIKKSPTFVMKAVIRGEVRTKVDLGRPPRYSSEDLDRLRDSDDG